MLDGDIKKARIRYSNIEPFESHARKPGHRYTLCGKYIDLSFASPDTFTPMKKLCVVCAVELRKVILLGE